MEELRTGTPRGRDYGSERGKKYGKGRNMVCLKDFPRTGLRFGEEEKNMAGVGFSGSTNPLFQAGLRYNHIIYRVVPDDYLFRFQ
jgi:hypothetical protein